MISCLLLFCVTRVHGKSLFPGDDEYTFAIAGNGADCPIRCPDEVVVPASFAEVAEAVQKARGANSSVAVRCGGHSMWCQWARGSGTLIDLRSLNGASVERGNDGGQVVRVGGGATFYEILPDLHKQGVHVLHGMVQNVGLGGITLGGGYHVELTPKFGWAVDSILGFTLVTPSGSLVHVNSSATSVISLSNYEPDSEALTAENWLWWAVKGSWSSFGAVVEFELVGHPYPSCTMDFMVVNAFLNIDGALKVVTDPPKGWSCTLLTAPVKLGMVPTGLLDYIESLESSNARTEGIMGCVKLHDDAEPKTINKLMKQYGVHTLTGIDIPVPLKLFETFQPCEGRHGGKLLGFGLVIGMDRNPDAALEILADVVSAKWDPHHAVWGTIIGGGGGFDLKSRTSLDWPKKSIFVALGGGNADDVINWVNSKMPEWQKTVDARVYPNWGDCSLENFGSLYWGNNYETLLAYKNKVDPTNIFKGIQLVGQGDTQCWTNDDESQSENCKKAGATQKQFGKEWNTVISDCKKKVPPYQIESHAALV